MTKQQRLALLTTNETVKEQRRRRIRQKQVRRVFGNPKGMNR